MTARLTTLSFKGTTYAAEVTTLCNGQQTALFQGPRGAWYTAFLRADGGAAQVCNQSMRPVGTAALLA